MKKIFILAILILLRCKIDEKNSTRFEIKNKIEIKKYVAGKNISVFDNSKNKIIFKINEGEIFTIESVFGKDNWRKIEFEGKTGYIENSDKNFVFLDKNLKYQNFLVIHKDGVLICKIPSNEFQCDNPIKKINYLEKLTLLDPNLINGFGNYIKVKQNDLVGFVKLADTVPEEILNQKKVESFVKKFQKICPSKEYKSNICLSTEKFLSGDDGEEWSERVAFSIHEHSNGFYYGRKYIETFGILFNVELIKKSEYKIYYLDSYDYIEKSFILELDLNKKSIYAPSPETVNAGSYPHLSRALKFQNGFKDRYGKVSAKKNKKLN